MSGMASAGSTGERQDMLHVVSQIARRLDARQPQITRDMSRLLSREIPKIGGDPDLDELLNASVEGNVKTIFHILANNIPIGHLQPTTAAVEYALRLAQREVPANALARAYHMGQDNFMDLVFGEAQALECRPELKLRALHYISDVVYRYIDWVSLFVLDVHEQERRRWIRTRGNVNASMIHNVLARQSVSEREFAAETGYRLDQNHVGVIVWAREESAGGDRHRALEQYIRKIASQFSHGGVPLIIAVDSTTAWAWIPMRQPERLDMAIVRDLTASAPGCRVAIGLPSHGIAGFRRSHDQAQATRQMMLISPKTTPQAVGFGDEGVAVVSLLAANLEATAAWVAEVLGPLARDDESASVLRETLRVFFSTSESYARTAELLNVHRNTVKYRINKVFGDKRHYVAPDHMDIALALHVCRFLGTKVLTPPSAH